VHDRFESRVLRAFVLLYLHQFLTAIRPVHFTLDDIMRFLDDETKIKVPPRRRQPAYYLITYLPTTYRSRRRSYMLMMRFKAYRR
jgi:hypothetical protein